MRKVLLVIGMQNGFFSSNSVLDSVRRLTLNPIFDEVIQLQYYNLPESHIEKELGWSGLQTPSDQLLLLNIPEASVIRFNTYAAVNGELMSKLDMSDDVYLCGVNTDACILATAFRLFDYGLKVSVIRDAVATKPEFHESALAIIRRNCGEHSVISSESL